MKTTSLILSAAVLVAGFSAPAITNTTIAVSGTNLVLSWPSHGYESYLIQYRQTLDATDAWTTLANAYPANSTNRTTFTLYGIVPPPNTNNGTGGGGGGAPLPNGFSAGSLSARHGGTTVPLVMPADGSGAAVPLALYPPGLDLSDFVILDPATGQWLDGSGHTSALAARPMGGASPMDADEDDAEVATGFYRVFHIPDWLVSLNGYTFDGPTFLPVDFAAPDAPTNYVDDVTLLINGQPFDEVQFIPYDINGTTYWGLGIYFDRLPNGTNTIQLLTTVRQSDELDDQTPYMTFSNAPQTIVIGNTISFTNWNDLILSNTYVFNAQSSVTNADWEIDIYDVYGNFVNSQTGHSDDGNISWAWDLTDYTGNSRKDDADPFFYPAISINHNPPAPIAHHPTNQFPDKGAWLFAYMDKFYDDGTSNYPTADSYYNNALQLMEGGPLLWGFDTYDYPIKYGRSYTQAERDDSWTTLKTSYLQSWSIRNFYYFGHGAATGIGGDINKLDSSNNITGARHLPNSNAYLSGDWTLGNITINKTYGKIPFRFVFLDGCDTAAGNMCMDWGVPKQVETVDYYRSSANKIHVRPNAFVGWDTEVGGKKADWGTIQEFWAFRSAWMAQWSVTYTVKSLSEALDEARDSSGWVPSQVNTHLKKFGYTSMGFQEYNQAGDWP
jgi:hypothetical protein